MRLHLILAATVVAALIPAAPAAAVPRLQLVTSASVADSSKSKEALAICPTGKVVLGGGGFVSGGRRQVHFQRLQALPPSNGFAAGAIERGTYTPSWRVYAYAICGSAPSGLEYVGFSTGTNSDSFKTATASCSGSKKLVSMGARIVGGNGEAIIDDMMLSATLKTTTANAYEDETGYGGNWRLYSYGVCANPLPGLEFRSVTCAVNSSDKLVSAACPAGKKVHGLGGAMAGPTGEAHWAGLYPAGDLNSSVGIAIEDTTGFGNNWWARSYAICAF